MDLHDPFERIRQADASQHAVWYAAADAQWQAWQDLPLDEWGSRHVTAAGVVALAAAYGRTVASPPCTPFFCEDCLCPCGRQSADPGGGFCVPCRLEAAL